MNKLKYFIIAAAFFSGAGSYAQQASSSNDLEVKGGIALYNNVYLAAYKQMDTLERINRNGVLFVKFNIIDSKIKNLRFSDENPKILISVLEGTLKNSVIHIEKAGTTDFVIPVFFDYRNMSTPKFADILKQLPNIDVNKLSAPDRSGDFDSFFEIRQSKDQMLAVPCVLLPWIKLSGKLQ